jgi:lysozyme family protein
MKPWPPSLEQARDAYRTHYWNPVRGDELPAPLALVAFDCAVNQGVGWATRALQRAVGVEADGKVGPVTLAAAWKAGWRGAHALTVERLARYQQIVTSRVGSWKYLTGWQNRALYAFRAAVKLEAA